MNTPKDTHPFASRVLRIYAWCMAAAVVVVQANGVVRACVHDGKLCDFGRFYFGARQWRAGGDLYGPNFATPAVIGGVPYEMQNVASPTWHLVVMPFTWLPPVAAFWIWILCNLVAWGWSLKICRDEWGISIDPRWYPVIAIGILASSLTGGAFHTGQYVGLLMLPATLAWRAARRGQWSAAGAWIGFLTSHKPFVLLFVAWMLWKRRFKGVAAAAIVLLASFIVGEITLGFGAYWAWQDTLREDVLAWTWLYSNASVWAPWARSLAPSVRYGHVMYPDIAFTLGFVSAVLVGIITGWRLRRQNNVDAAWLMLWSAALLISPLGWTYYLWWAAGPAGVVVSSVWREHPGSRWRLWVLAACFLAPLSLNIVMLGQPSPLASFTIGSLYTWALVFLWTAANPRRVALLWRRPEAATGSS